MGKTLPSPAAELRALPTLRCRCRRFRGCRRRGRCRSGRPAPACLPSCPSTPTWSCSHLERPLSDLAERHAFLHLVHLHRQRVGNDRHQLLRGDLVLVRLDRSAIGIRYELRKADIPLCKAAIPDCIVMRLESALPQVIIQTELSLLGTGCSKTSAASILALSRGRAKSAKALSFKGRIVCPACTSEPGAAQAESPAARRQGCHRRWRRRPDRRECGRYPLPQGLHRSRHWLC